MIKLDFRIDWGYQYLYSRRHYHPVYRWDGGLECVGGKIVNCYQLEYPVIWFGPGHCARETPLAEPRWQSSTRRGLAGVRIVAETDENAEFRLTTASGTFLFSAREIIESGRIVFPVGPKYLSCNVIVTRTGHFWFRPQPAPGQQVWEADELPGLPVHDWARMKTAWLAPGAKAGFEVDVPASKADYCESILHLVAMAAPEYTPGAEKQVHDYFPMQLYCDDRPVAEFSHYFREHDRYMQMLEDVWIRFPMAPGKHRLALRNGNKRFYLLLNRVILQQAEYDHLQLSLPTWALTGEPLTGRLFAAREDQAEISWPGGKTSCNLVPGWNEFAFSLDKPGIDVPVTVAGTDGNSTENAVGAVYELGEEAPEVTVGYDMTVVPHDDCGFMDWLLDYTWRTRLGNLVVFRSFVRKSPESMEMVAISPDKLTRWGEFCRKHRIYVEAATDFDDGALVKAAGEMLHSVGKHEWPGAVYAFNPEKPWQSDDMKSAMENYLRYLKIEIDRAHQAAPRAAFGDASGGHRYCYLAGADFIRTETMVPHTQHLCSQARPAAEALGNGEWGVHIAIQHAMQPYMETHLGIYFLSLFQPWMMGASMIYEEDCLFQLFKEERQAWDDAMTKGKRDMTREFFRFVKTHPRKGKVRRNIAFLEGRYAAPFNGFICDSEQDPHYSVWGRFGNPDPAWGHGQPEKCRQLLDVLMPGASTQPLRQHYERRRFFFSGTPYGDFDEVPVEANSEYLNRYGLLLNLGWNTMIREDYDKLRSFVANGGTLFTGLPQFSTHVRRDFLRDWRRLALWDGGNLAELCGVNVNGPGVEYSGQWNAAARETFNTPELSALPSDNLQEDGVCRLAEVELRGAEVVAWDAASGKPLLVCNRVGKGRVYLITAWAYPGHEQLQEFSATWLERLAREHRGEYYVQDPSGEVFWNVSLMEHGCARMMMLNTDWTTPGNCKRVKVYTPGNNFELDVTEREPMLLDIVPGAAFRTEPAVHAEVVSSSPGGTRIRLHGLGKILCHIYHQDGNKEIREVDFGSSTVTEIKI